MIYVTGGHEKGIGLEVFFKSYSSLPLKVQKKVTLIFPEKELGNYPNIKVPKALKIISPKKISTPSYDSLNWAIDNLKEKDILLTLPTSKDQINFKKNYLGHTEYFRDVYNNQFIAMCFKNFNYNTLLVSDHIPVKEISSKITPKMIINKVCSTLEGFGKYFHKINHVFVTGLNPHAGENGLLGNEENSIKEAIITLKSKFDISFYGPIPPDSLQKEKIEKDKLFVYMYHDQLLPLFKARSSQTGLNISFGMPFLRMSVDHGTAFEIYGKNKANSTSCLLSLVEAYNISNRI